MTWLLLVFKLLTWLFLQIFMVSICFFVLEWITLIEVGTAYSIYRLQTHRIPMRQ